MSECSECVETETTELPQVSPPGKETRGNQWVGSMMDVTQNCSSTCRENTNLFSKMRSKPKRAGSQELHTADWLVAFTLVLHLNCTTFPLTVVAMLVKWDLINCRSICSPLSRANTLISGPKQRCLKIQLIYGGQYHCVHSLRTQWRVTLELGRNEISSLIELLCKGFVPFKRPWWKWVQCQGRKYNISTTNSTNLGNWWNKYSWNSSKRKKKNCDFFLLLLLFTTNPLKRLNHPFFFLHRNWALKKSINITMWPQKMYSVS